MKKFTLLILLFVCAIGFSQRSATSLSDVGPSVYAQDQAESVSVPLSIASQSVSSLGEYSPIYVQHTVRAVEYKSITSGDDVVSSHGLNNAIYYSHNESLLENVGPCATVGPGNGFENGKSFTNNLGRIVAHDVTVAADEDYVLEIISLNAFMGGTGSGVNAAFVDVYVYENAGGAPGALITSELGVIPTSQTVVGGNFGFDIWEVVLDVADVPLAGQAGVPTTYWIGASLETTDGSNTFWENSTAGLVGLGEAYDDGTGFVIDSLLEGVYTINGTCSPSGGGGGGNTCGTPLLEVNQDFSDACMAFITQTGIAQGYQPVEVESAGAGFQFEAPPAAGTGLTVTLYDDLPPNGGVALASGTTVADGASVWLDVFWDVTIVTPGNQYFLVVTGSADTCMSGSLNDVYPGGNVYANAGYQSFPNFDYTFRTYSCDGGGSTCTSTPYVSTAVPFDIDGAGTSTADCVGAPNLVPVTVGDAGTIGTDADIENVTIDITHTWSGDLEIYLVAPSGTELLMWDNVGGSGDNFTNTQFEDGGIPTAGSTAPHTGVYQPVGGDFATTFAGEDITGDWQLKICDTAGGDTGTVDSFTLTLCITASVDNDTCATATAVACGDTVLGDTSNNTDQGGANASPDEWFSFTGTGTPEIVTISLCDGGTSYDSLLSVYDSCGGAQIAVNDDSCGLQSEVSFASDGVSTYYIAVEGFGSASGAFSLAVTCSQAPINDECANAIEVSCGDFIAGTTVNANIDDAVAPTCDTGVTSPGVWYVLNDNSGLAGSITITMCTGTTDYDSKLSVYTGDCGAPPLTCVVGNDDTCGLQSEVTFASDGNSTFLILVHGFGGATGNFELDIQCTPTPPPNDMIANSIDVDEIGFPYTDPQVAMPAATVEAGTPVGCDNAGAKGVWYNFIPEGDGTATATIITPGEPGALFSVNNGPLAGDYNAVPALFGGAIPTTPLTEDTVVVIDDDTTGDPNDACDPILNGSSLSGKIAIVRRGACEFGVKALAAENEGAVAVIVVNNQPGDPIAMGGGAVGDQVTIPAVMVSDADGEAIITELAGGGTVNVTLVSEPAGFSSVTFYTAPNENAVETDLVLVDYWDNQCVPGIDASIATVAGQAYYVYVVNHGAVTDIVIDGTNLGVSDNEIEGFVYYPNPAADAINLESVEMIEQVAIFSILGQKVIDLNVEATNSQISVSHLATGTYVMKVTVNGQVGTYKVIKK